MDTGTFSWGWHCREADRQRNPQAPSKAEGQGIGARGREHERRSHIEGLHSSEERRGPRRMEERVCLI